MQLAFRPDPNLATTARVFLSYARVDGDISCESLLRRLINSGLTAWRDKSEMKAGPWQSQIHNAIRNAEHFVLIVTLHAFSSSVVQWECRTARREGRQVALAYDSRVFTYEYLAGVMPLWMRKQHMFDVSDPEQFESLAKTLREPGSAKRVPNFAPSLPAQYVPRTAVISAIGESLRTASVAGTSSSVLISGPAGFGKSTLAAALCHDGDIDQLFPDGVFWLRLDQDSDRLLSSVAGLVDSLDGKGRQFPDLGAALHALELAINKSSMLFVLDDVWRRDQAEMFIKASNSHCVFLITSRHRDLDLANCVTHFVEELSESESMFLLRTGLPSEHIRDPEEVALRRLNASLFGWPLLLTLIGGVLRRRLALGARLADAIEQVLARFAAAGVIAFDNALASRRDLAIGASLELSLAELTIVERSAFLGFAVFPAEAAVPLGILDRLLESFASKPQSTEDFVVLLQDLNLIKGLDLEFRRFQLHHAISQYLSAEVGANLTASHARLAAKLEADLEVSLSQKDDGVIEYMSDYLLWHADKGHAVSIRGSLLSRLDWLEEKIVRRGAASILQDLGSQQTDPKARWLVSLVQSFVDLIDEAPRDLGRQMIARLPRGNEASEQLRRTSDLRLRQKAGEVLLLPVAPSFTLPGPQRGIYRGHPSWVMLNLAMPGRQVLSASIGGDMILWDASTRVERIFYEQQGPGLLRFCPDSAETFLVGDSRGDVRLWTFADSKPVRIWKAHDAPIKALAKAGGDTLVSLDEAGACVWTDMPSGTRRFVFPKRVTGLAGASADQIIVVTADGELHRCDHDGAGTLIGRTDPDVALLKLLPDGGILSASRDGHVRVCRSGGRSAEAKTRFASGWVSCAEKLDDKHMLLGTSAGDVVRFSIATGLVLETYFGHGRTITALAVLEGDRIVAASYDTTILQWRLGESSPVRRLEGHTNGVTALSVISGTELASSSYDKTVRLWQLSDPIDHRWNSERHTYNNEALQRLVSRGAHDRSTQRYNGWIEDSGDLRLASSAPASSGAAHQARSDGAKDKPRVPEQTALEGKLIHGLLIFEGARHFSSPYPVDVPEKLTFGFTMRAPPTCCHVIGDRILAVGQKFGWIQCWDLRARREIFCEKLHRGDVTMLETVDSHMVVSGGTDGSVFLIDVRSGSRVKEMPNAGGVVTSLWGDAEKIVAGAMNGLATVFDVKTATNRGGLRGHDRAVTGVCNVGAAYFLTVSSDRTARLWNNRFEEVDRLTSDVSFTGLGRTKVETDIVAYGWDFMNHLLSVEFSLGSDR